MNDYVKKISSKAFKDAVVALRNDMAGVEVDKRAEISKGEKVDPVAAAFEMDHYRQDYEQWKEERELPRRWQKSLTTHLGTLHQDLIGQLKGWDSFHPKTNRESEPDLVGKIGTQRVIVELKSSQNTLNGSSKANTYEELCARLDGSQNAGKYGNDYIGIVLFLRTDVGARGLWAPFTAGKGRPARSDLVRMGGRTFYALATAKRPSFAADAVNNTPGNLEELKLKDSWGSIDDMFARIFDTLKKLGTTSVPPDVVNLLKDVYKY